MLELVSIVTSIVAVATFCAAYPQKDGILESGPPPQDTSNTDPLKEVLAEGKVHNVVDYIQKVLGLKKVVRVRTKWGGGPQGEIRNTVDWSAWKSDRSNLKLILDSKVARHHGKVDFLNNNMGLSFQVKY